MDEPVIYNKTCRFCNQEYTSTSRNQRYCSEVCAEKAKKVRLAKQKKAKARQKKYADSKELQRLLARAYSLSQDLGALIPHVCPHTVGSSRPCEGPLQLHHKDKNPFNISLSNLVWVCRAEHEYLDPRDEDRSIIEILQASLESNDPQQTFNTLVYDPDNALHKVRARERKEARDLNGLQGQNDKSSDKEI